MRAISLGATPSESSVTLETSYENLVELVEQETGHTVELNNAWDYAAAVDRHGLLRRVHLCHGQRHRRTTPRRT